jgi:hypothetical protein
LPTINVRSKRLTTRRGDITWGKKEDKDMGDLKLEKPRFDMVSNKCDKVCYSKYIEDGEVSKLEDCLKACNPKDSDKVALLLSSIKGKCAKRKEWSFWGRFAFDIAFELTKEHINYNNALSERSMTEKNGPNDGTIDWGWRRGVRISLGTGPSYTRLGETLNVLSRISALDLVIFSGNNKSYPQLQKKHDWGQPVSPEVLSGDFLIPFYKNTYFRVGGDLIRWDDYWGLTMINPMVGFDYQFQGESLTKSDRVFDIYGARHTLQSYTMFGLNARLILGLQLLYEPNSGGTSYGDEPAVLFPITARLVGEQRFSFGALGYEASVSYYPIYGKVVLNGKANFDVFLGKAIYCYLRAGARGLFSSEDDQQPLMPDDGHDINFSLGCGFRPSAIF